MARHAEAMRTRVTELLRQGLAVAAIVDQCGVSRKYVYGVAKSAGINLARATRRCPTCGARITEVPCRLCLTRREQE